MPAQVIGHLALQVVAALRPLVEKTVQLLDVHEQVRCRAELGRGPRQRADRVFQIGGAIGRSALFATVAVLIGRAALGTRPFDEPIGQKRPGLRIVKLRHVSLG